ncbi:hypothetical protein BJ912DRAFT_971441 [Pholiota molesta]|nr:hypothetical protein BJ912DRAFT_971441 [Pholiota molesta]
MTPSNDNDLKLFRGDYANAEEKPHTWFRKLERQFDETTTLARKHYKFAYNLEPAHTAELWYQARTPPELADWKAFYAAFTERWPKPTVNIPTRDYLQATLTQLKLDDASVGCTVGPANEQILSHIAWAEQVKTLVNAIGDDGGLLITSVRDALPLAIRLALDSTGKTATTWKDFLAQVNAITYTSLKNHLDLLAITQKAPTTTMTALTSQFSNQSISTPFTPAQPPAYIAPQPYQSPITPTAAAPFTPPFKPRDTPPHIQWQTPQTPRYITPGARQNPNDGNLFWSTPSTLRPGQTQPVYKLPPTPQTPQTPSPNQRTQPSSLDVQELAKRAIAASAMYSNDAAGTALYETALATWNALHPNLQDANFLTTVYPLRPGTAQIGSRECFRCGYTGHIATIATGGCINPTAQLDRREQNWRTFISRALYSRTRFDTVRVSQITSTDEAPVYYSAAIYDTESLQFDDETVYQGNGQEMRT